MLTVYLTSEGMQLQAMCNTPKSSAAGAFCSLQPLSVSDPLLSDEKNRLIRRKN